jgi:chromosome partitioning protein|tara:strand:+ start:75 stop:857 length:783 start_codon:yes stop_codon:yes gene_type:complete
MRVWAVANQKGGVGKTTTAVTLGGLLAERGERVLLLDLDPHGSMTSYFGYDPDILKSSSFNLFAAEDLTLPQFEKLLLTTSSEYLTLLPSSMALATIERRATVEGMGLKVARALALAWDKYDYVLIDSPPVLGALMINALAASERLLVPVQTEFLALKGLERMIRTISMVTRSLKKNLHYTIVPTMFDRRTQASVKTLRAMRNTYSESIWPAMIPVDTRFRDASKEGEVPSQHAPGSRGVGAYQSLLKYLLLQQQQRKQA